MGSVSCLFQDGIPGTTVRGLIHGAKPVECPDPPGRVFCSWCWWNVHINMDETKKEASYQTGYEWANFESSRKRMKESNDGYEDDDEGEGRKRETRRPFVRKNMSHECWEQFNRSFFPIGKHGPWTRLCLSTLTTY